MNREKIDNLILTELTSLFDFEEEDIAEIEENCDSIFITLKNEDVYIITLMKVENE